MTISRRNVLKLAAAAGALPAFPCPAIAQAYPARPVRIVTGFPPGNAPDLVARLMGQALSDHLGQTFVVENRPGAASNLGTEAVVRAAPDGYTILMGVLSSVFNATLYPNLSFNYVDDIAPVAGIADAPFIIVVTPSYPANNIAELIAYAKKNPGKTNMASAGKGSASHVFGELLKSMAGVDLLHVPYRGSAMPDLISGQMHIQVSPIPQAIALVRGGQLRALAVTTAKRLPFLPDIPTVGETVTGYDAVGWYGWGAPKGTPGDIVSKINDATTAALADPKIQARLLDFGVQPMPMKATDFGRFVKAEHDKWSKVIKSAGITPEG
jgi:tripartite-type tricarboxylate transporter receptor subunit TctC